MRAILKLLRTQKRHVIVENRPALSMRLHTMASRYAIPSRQNSHRKPRFRTPNFSFPLFSEILTPLVLQAFVDFVSLRSSAFPCCTFSLLLADGSRKERYRTAQLSPRFFFQILSNRLFQNLGRATQAGLRRSETAAQDSETPWLAQPSDLARHHGQGHLSRASSSTTTS